MELGMEHWRDDNDTENPKYWKKKIVSMQLFPSHIPHSRSKLVLRSESPANNRVIGGTAEMLIK
jgi:hypothetical protein